MRILLLSFLNPAIVPGGEQQIAYEMFRAAWECGHDVWLLSGMGPGPQFAERFGRPGAPITPLADAERQYLYFPKFYDWRNFSVGDWRSNEYLREFIAKLNPEVIHFHHYHWLGVEAIRVARLAAPKAVIGMTFHEMLAICMADGQMVTRTDASLCERAEPMNCSHCFPEVRPEFFDLRASRLKYFLSGCDVFVFPTNFMKQRYLDWGLPAEKCVTIPNGQKGVGDAAIRTVHSPKFNRFGYFGQFLTNKGVDILFNAILMLARNEAIPPNGIVVELNGCNADWAAPAYIEKLKSLLDEIRVYHPAVEVVDRGPYPHASLGNRMASCDWVVVPSTWWENFTSVVSEAWMCGRPVIVSDIGGLAERVTNGVNGMTFPVKDPVALGSLILKLTENSALWHKLNGSITPPNTDHEMLSRHVAEWRTILDRREAA